jgi:hypothetical protein
MGSFTEYMIEQIEDKTKKRAKVLPMWKGHDADIVLCDLMKSTDFERNGIAQDIFLTWKYSDESGRDVIEKMFYLFTETPFDAFLMRCDKALSA